MVFNKPAEISVENEYLVTTHSLRILDDYSFAHERSNATKRIHVAIFQSVMSY